MLRVPACLRFNVAGEPMADLLVIAPSDEPLTGVEVGGSVIPRLIDEIPLLAAIATTARGQTVIRDAAELRHKESDRIGQTARQLKRMGADIEELQEGLVIKGGELHGAEVNSAGDHRLAMTLAVAGLRASGISNPQCECSAGVVPWVFCAACPTRC